MERRLLPQDWVTRLKAAQIKSEQLRNDFPTAHQEEAVKSIQKLWSQGMTGDFVYKDAKAVFEALTERTEEGRQKTFLGRYKSPLVNEWQILLRIYERDNLYLAEYGKIVQQLQGFDLPAMKKQMQTMVKQVSEGQQKRNECQRSIKEQERLFKEECMKLGIQPSEEAVALERQAIKMVEQLAPKFQEIQRKIQSATINELVSYYKEFNSIPKESLPMLSYLVQNGDENLAKFEFKKSNPGKAIPQDIEEREEHKYDLYNRFDQIYFNESSSVVNQAEGGAIDIDWS